ncbi:MAG: RNA polymerase sigma factor [Chitinophagales bacterium]
MKQKDKKAQLFFYKYCFNTLMRVAYRYKNNKEDAAALVNDSFLNVLQNIEKYNIKKPLEPWLKRIAINKAIDDFRKYNKINNVTDSFEALAYENKLEQKEILDENYKLEDLQLRVNLLLPKASKTVFYLYAIDGFAHKEIAKKLKISEETSKWHVKNARKILRENKDKILN